MQKTNSRGEEIEQAQVVFPPCISCQSTGERRADKRMKSGWSSYCRVCANEKSTAWKLSNQERQLASTKAWRKENPDRVKATRAKGMDKERAAALAWRHSNIERARANDASYQRNNPMKVLLKDHKRRATKLEATRGDPITKETIDAMYESQHGLCGYCKRELNEVFHIDHFVPLAKDGPHSAHNLLLSCPTCNLQKGAKQPDKFMIEKQLLNNEAREQSRLIIWSHRKSVRDLMPDLKWLHHSPNGEKRDIRTGNKLKALGVKRGFPDLILPVSSGFSSGLVIEMKSAIGRTSPEQKEWLAHFEAQKWQVEIARSAQEAREMICRYLGTRPQDAPELV